MPLGSKAAGENPVSNIIWAWRSGALTVLLGFGVFLFGVIFVGEVEKYAQSSCEDAMISCYGEDAQSASYYEMRNLVIRALTVAGIGMTILGIWLGLVGVSGMCASAKSSVSGLTATMCCSSAGGLITLAVFGVGVAAHALLSDFCSSVFQWESADSTGHSQCTALANAFLPLFCDGLEAGDIYCFSPPGEDQCACGCDDTVDAICLHIPTGFLIGGLLCIGAAFALIMHACCVCHAGICCHSAEKRPQLREVAGGGGRVQPSGGVEGGNKGGGGSGATSGASQAVQ